MQIIIQGLAAYLAHIISELFSRRLQCLANVYCSKVETLYDFVKTDHGSQSVNIIASTWESKEKDISIGIANDRTFSFLNQPMDKWIF